MSDLIERQAAIDAVENGCQEWKGIFQRCEANIKTCHQHSQNSGGFRAVRGCQMKGMCLSAKNQKNILTVGGVSLLLSGWKTQEVGKLIGGI